MRCMFNPGREEIVVQGHVVFCMRFKIFITWNVTPCNVIAYPEGTGSMFLQNVGNDAPLCSIISQKMLRTKVELLSHCKIFVKFGINIMPLEAPQPHFLISYVLILIKTKVPISHDTQKDMFSELCVHFVLIVDQAACLGKVHKTLIQTVQSQCPAQSL